MRIDKIVLHNFGSYEGENIFDTKSEAGKNIVLIGGKNGAGKTTLFTAMRICLYGYMSMGYKNQNAFYFRAITKMINNAAKLSKPAEASVMMRISLSNGRSMDCYEMNRSWQLDDTLTESFTVCKNGILLNAAEIADFEKYLLSIIPPELFNLYFFDGEKIADFFMNEGSNVRIKEAFLTLCGYDTFEIMRRNFKRISGGNSSSAAAIDDYWNAKNSAAEAEQAYQDLLARMDACVDALASCEAEIVMLEKTYAQSGGATQEEWNKKLLAIKEEEKKREVWNAVLRKWATEVIPFVMLRDQINALKSQISAENAQTKYQNFCELLNVPEMDFLSEESIVRMKEIAFSRFGRCAAPILDISFEQCMKLSVQINDILSFDPGKIEKYRKSIKKSIEHSAALRQELDNSNISSVHEYMQRKAALYEEKSSLLDERVSLEQSASQYKEVLFQARAELAKTQSRLEADLKKASINDISAKAILMLDQLQQVLYRQQISKVEAYFRMEIRTLMRKTRFIDDIKIDDNFNIFLYRKEMVSKTILIDALSTNSEDQLRTLIGEDAIVQLQKAAGADSMETLLRYCRELSVDAVELPIRIDQTSLSNGEKQIFIMALYHSLVRLGRHEIPFIIDTPFARIDTEHRHNISKFFFSQLHGQVFILSTNEEINSDHVCILKDKIAATYMLENTDNKKTVVVQDSYFEV